MTHLADTEWTVIAYSDGDGGFEGVLTGTTLTLAFAADGRVYGSGGCNSYTGSCTVSPPAISIGTIAATRKFCSAPEGVMAQESAFFAALTAAASYTTDGARLQLWTGSGSTAVELEARRAG